MSSYKSDMFLDTDIHPLRPRKKENELILLTS